MPVQKLDEVSELIRYILFSDYIELDKARHETPVSAAIIAAVESGKTSIISQFIPCNGILYLTDVTAWGLQHKYVKQLQSGKYHRIVIPDLINPLNRKQETVDSLITFFNSYISWEGVSSIMTFAMQLEIDPPVTGSLLTSIATDDFRRMLKKLAAVGFISRLLLINYEYSEDAINDILQSIAAGTGSWDKMSLGLPDTKTKVTIKSGMAKRLIPVAESIGKRASAYGFRALHQLMVLARSRALAEGRRDVNMEDVIRIAYLVDKFVYREDLL